MCHPCVYTTALDVCRLMLNNSQKSVLKAAFTYNCFPNKTTLMQLAQQTGLTKQRVSQWFTTRRSYIRRIRKEGTPSINERYGNN